MRTAHQRIKSEMIRTKIKSQRLKMYWVAAQTGVHKTTLRRWLSRSIDGVSPSRIERLAAVLGSEPAELVETSAL